MEERMSGGKKFGYFCLTFVPLIAYTVLSLGVGILMSVAVMIPTAMKSVMEGQGDIYTELMSHAADISMLAGIVYASIAIVGMGLWYRFGCKRKGLKPPKEIRNPLNLLLIAAFAFCMQYATQLIMIVIDIVLPSLMDDYEQLMEMAGLGQATFLGALYVVILGPIAEELVFRGVTLYYAQKFTRRFWLANLLQAVLFGVLHLNLVQGLYATVLGLAIGWIYHRFRSMYACIFIHIFFNFLAYGPLVFLDGLLPQHMAFQIIWCGLMCALAVLLLWLLTKRTARREREA